MLNEEINKLLDTTFKLGNIALSYLPLLLELECEVEFFQPSATMSLIFEAEVALNCVGHSFVQTMI